METYELCLDRYTAARTARALCVDLEWAPRLGISAEETGAIIERVVRHAVEEIESYSEELRNPDKIWQVSRMLDRPVVCRRFLGRLKAMLMLILQIQESTERASTYGKRWFGITQEFCLYIAHALVCVHPPHTRKYLLEVVRSRPTVFDILLDCAMLPRRQEYPDTCFDECGSYFLCLRTRTWLIKHISYGNSGDACPLAP